MRVDGDESAVMRFVTPFRFSSRRRRMTETSCAVFRSIATALHVQAEASYVRSMSKVV